jgi:hypothetical protein
MNEKQKHAYQMGARLARTGDYDVRRVRLYCADYGVAADLHEWVIRGCADEHRCNPHGLSGQPLGDPSRYKNKIVH